VWYTDLIGKSMQLRQDKNRDLISRLGWAIPGWAVMAWLCLGSLMWLGSEPSKVIGQDVKKVSDGVSYKPGDVNLEFSRVYIFVDKTNNLGHTHGVEGKLKQGMLLEESGEDGSLVFDMKSFVADTPTARKVFAIEAEIDAGTVKKVNQNMLGAEILDVQKHPEASLTKAVLKKSGKKTAKGNPEYLLEGDFTLHGVSKRVSVPCDGELKDGWLHVRGRFTIRQTEFGIKPYSKMFGAVGIKDELIIQGDLWLVPKS
jgi:polyisoprenoid-binding protein YceI